MEAEAKQETSCHLMCHICVCGMLFGIPGTHAARRTDRVDTGSDRYIGFKPCIVFRGSNTKG